MIEAEINPEELCLAVCQLTQSSHEQEVSKLSANLKRFDQQIAIELRVHNHPATHHIGNRLSRLLGLPPASIEEVGLAMLRPRIRPKSNSPTTVGSVARVAQTEEEDAPPSIERVITPTGALLTTPN